MKTNKIRCTIYLFLCVIMVYINIMTVYAAANSDSDTWPEGPSIQAEAAVLMDADTGTVLYEKNAAERLYPASITKIMTTLVAIENSSLSDEVTFTNDMMEEVEYDSSRLGVSPGEHMTMEQCLYVIMLASANDVAYGVAEQVGGSIDSFVELMNQKAAELGCVDTHFVNPHGLQDENHYTSAHDMALIMKAAMENETFKKISGTTQYIISPTNEAENGYIVNNHHKMITNSQYSYEGCTGGKTGYTTLAGNTLVTTATRGDLNLICVVLKDQTPNHYLDTAELLDWGFDTFQAFSVTENETKYQLTESTFFDSENHFFTDQSLSEIDAEDQIILPKTASFEQTESQLYWEEDKDGTSIGSLTYTYAGKTVGTAAVQITDNDTEEYVNLFGEQTEAENDSNSGGQLNVWNYCISAKLIYIFFSVAVLVVLIIIFRLIRKKRGQYWERRKRIRRHRKYDRKRGSRLKIFEDSHKW